MAKTGPYSKKLKEASEHAEENEEKEKEKEE